MQRLKPFVAVLLAVMWLLASSHALLEQFELIHQTHADHDADSSGSHEHDADNHDAADAKCTLASTHVSVPLPDSVAMPLLFCAPGLNWTCDLDAESDSSGLSPPGTAPPQLLHRWQFSFRTALPARAPSLIS